MNTTDLTARPPRSPRVRLGGYAILPRLLDKARATAAGRSGAYKFDSAVDSFFLGFTGLAAADILARVKAGDGDADILAWIQQTAPRPSHEIAAWSTWVESAPLSDAESREWLAGELRRLDVRRADIHSIFDYLDLDDYLSFGGQK